MSETERMLGPASPFSLNAKPGEGEQFTCDAFDHENDGRSEIDSFRFARYVVLGWIRETERFPYYELTVAGEVVYWKWHAHVAPKVEGWADDDDWEDEYDDDD